MLNAWLTQLAYELGYTSDAAFRNAFKLRYGVPPSRFTLRATPGEGGQALTRRAA